MVLVTDIDNKFVHFCSDEIDHNQIGDDDFDFKDNSEEYTYHERTETTKTEKITSTKRRSGNKQQIDLGAAASQLKRDQSGDQQVNI